MAKAKDRRYRIQLDFSQRTFDQLNRLQSRLDASSRAEVIRRALNHLDSIITLIDEGTEIMVKRAGVDKPVCVEFPLLGKQEQKVSTSISI